MSQDVATANSREAIAGKGLVGSIFKYVSDLIEALDALAAENRGQSPISQEIAKGDS